MSCGVEQQVPIAPSCTEFTACGGCEQGCVCGCAVWRQANTRQVCRCAHVHLLPPRTTRGGSPDVFQERKMNKDECSSIMNANIDAACMHARVPGATKQMHHQGEALRPPCMHACMHAAARMAWQPPTTASVLRPCR